MEFKKYCKIQNSYSEKFIDKIVQEGKDYGSWIVTEKIHGANFSFWYDGEMFKTGSRNQFVGGDFYNCQEVIDKYQETVMLAHEAMCKKGDILTIYGELYGDGVQKGIKYGSKDFMFFDVRVNNIPLPYGIAMIISQMGLQSVPTIATGDFKSVLEINTEFPTVLNPELGNICEGVVIAPWEPRFLSNGSRVILKKKNKKFLEKKTVRKKKSIPTLDPEDEPLYNILMQYNTEARANNVASKIGKVTHKEFGKLLGLTVQDMIQDMEADYGIGFKKSVQGDYKGFMKEVNKGVTPIVRKVYTAMLE